MLFIKVRTIIASVITIAVLAAGAGSMLRGDTGPGPEARSGTGSGRTGGSPRGRRGPTGGAPRDRPASRDLAWIDVAPPERLHVLEQLAVQSKVNYEKIKTWRGSYSYMLRQYLDTQFVAQLLAGAGPLGGEPAPQGKAGPLMQEFDSVLTFAIDAGSDAIYRDAQTSRMRFLKVGTDEEVKIPNVGSADHRSIVTPGVYLFFYPKERATSSFLPDHPEAQMKRRVERFPAREARMREGGTPDPREFFKFDSVNFFWSGLELYARAFRGDLGAEQKNVVEQRLKIYQADGPGGRWYRDQMSFTNPDGSTLWVATVWSPQAGYNAVSMVRTLDTPVGRPESTIEWQWKVIDGVYIPSTIKESAYRAARGELSKEQVTRLKDCALNRPLDPHQFDEKGLGVSDGDLVLNHLERVAYIIKGGEPVKLANFGEGSVLRPARAKPLVAPAPAPAVAARTGPRPSGRIYTTASLGTNDAGRPISSVVAVDPESGDVTKVFDSSPGRLRISPDGRRAAFVSGEWWSNLPPHERMRNSLWIREFAGGARPERVLYVNDGATAGDLPVWSADGKRIILSVGHRDESRKQWVYETFRINADGSGREPLGIPDQDGVQDWSPDGAWVVTTSSRNAKIGWQLYVMRPDGKDQRQLTEGGNPFYARFSPDGRRLLYTDGPSQERRGIWVVDLDGKNRRRILPTDKGTASACWSPDGLRFAVAIGGSKPEEHGRLEIVDLDGTHRTLLTLPSREIADMPDWR